MKKVSFAIVLTVGAGLIASTASPTLGGTGGTIFNGAASFVRTNSSFDSTPEASLTGLSAPGSQDHLFELGWAFRVAGDSHETFFGAPSSETYDGDYSFIQWSDVGARGLFSASEDTSLVVLASGGYIVQTLTITNLSANNLDVHIFHMVDIDLQPTFSDDLGVLREWTPNRIIGIEDPGSNFATYVASPLADQPPAAGFLVRVNGAGDVGALLADAGITTFDNSGLPFGPGDLTAGYDFHLIFPPLNSAYARVWVMINHARTCDMFVVTGIFCDGLELGNRSLWSSSEPPDVIYNPPPTITEGTGTPRERR